MTLWEVDLIIFIQNLNYSYLQNIGCGHKILNSGRFCKICHSSLNSCPIRIVVSALRTASI
jgi:hypothetical protein